MPATNAAIWFSADGYNPTVRGINGRRVAGASFLRGFFAHGDVDEFVSLAHSRADHVAFAQLARDRGVTRPLRAVRLDAPAALAPVEVVSFPAPISTQECWRRATHGAAAWALCGITHTTATRAIMQSVFDLRSAPQMPWDAVICTSKSVHASIAGQMDLTDQFLAARFGGKAPPRPLLPVIPLGITCDDFTPDPAAGAALRTRLGIAQGDIACAIIARLTPHEKFDPLPLYLSLARAQRISGRRYHLLLCGQLRDDYSRKVFAEGARGMMPEVGFHLLDGADAAEQVAARFAQIDDRAGEMVPASGSAQSQSQLAKVMAARALG